MWTRHLAYLKSFLTKPNYQAELRRLAISDRVERVESELARIQSPAYRQSLVGTLGTDPELI